MTDTPTKSIRTFLKPVAIPRLDGQSPKTLQAISGQGSLNINIRRFYTDVNGTILSKSSGIIPTALNTKYPIFLLGNFDRVGGRNISLKTIKIPVGPLFLMTYVHGYDSQPFQWNSGFNTVQNNFRKGDIIDVWTDSYDAPSVFVFIAQTCEYGGLASIITNTMTQQEDGRIGTLHVDKINFAVDQDSQVTNVWQVVRLDNLGQFQQQPFSPILYKDPYYSLGQFIQLPLQFTMTQFVGINFLMDYESDLVQVNFLISKH